MEVEAEVQAYRNISPAAWYSVRDGAHSACVICGAAIVSIVKANGGCQVEDWGWMSRSTLLTDETLFFTDGRSFNYGKVPSPFYHEGKKVHFGASNDASSSTNEMPRQRPIKRLPAQSCGKDWFLLTDGTSHYNLTFENTTPVLGGLNIAQEELGPAVEVFQISGREHPLLHLPVHDACLSILDDFILRQNDPSNDIDVVRSVSEAWDAFRFQLHAGRDFRDILADACAEGPLAGCPWSEVFDYSLEPREYAFMADPDNVPGYTESLLSCAELLSTKEAGTANLKFDQLFNDLPGELADRIIDYIKPFSKASTACTRILAPSTWKKLLLDQNLVPFLWDLDKSVLQSTELAMDSIDWERLARLLVQPGNIGKGHVLERLSPGLKNRMRIWQLLGNMRPGDLRPIECVQKESSGHGQASIAEDNFGETTSPPAKDPIEKEQVSISLAWVKWTHDEMMAAHGETFGSPRIAPRGGHWELRWRRGRKELPESNSSVAAVGQGQPAV